MQKGSFRELDMEWDFRNPDYTDVINRLLRETDTSTNLLPWPKPFPGRMWVDNTDRYDAAQGGPVMEFYNVDAYGGDPAPVPGDQTSVVLTDRKEEVEREDARVSVQPNMERIQARNPSPTEWIRLETENEEGEGFGNLEEQEVVMHHFDKEGGRVSMSMDYNPIFAPFDLREHSWYRVRNTDGAVVAESEEDVAKKLSFDPEGLYRIYLRPANWRWVMTVYATYVYVSWFEAFYNRQVFTQAYYQRPPVYPKRHKILNPAEGPDGTAYDEAINVSFEYSRAAAFLSHQIIDAQWWTMSEAYIFVGNDPGELAVTLYAPNDGDIVMGVGRVDPYGGAEEVLWVEQKVNASTLESERGWTPTFLDLFWVPWFVTPS
jgi:hypothetical protein